MKVGGGGVRFFKMENLVRGGKMLPVGKQQIVKVDKVKLNKLLDMGFEESKIIFLLKTYPRLSVEALANALVE